LSAALAGLMLDDLSNSNGSTSRPPVWRPFKLFCWRCLPFWQIRNCPAACGS